jgi:hypothetical protein
VWQRFDDLQALSSSSGDSIVPIARRLAPVVDDLVAVNPGNAQQPCDPDDHIFGMGLQQKFKATFQGSALSSSAIYENMSWSPSVVERFTLVGCYVKRLRR